MADYTRLQLRSFQTSSEDWSAETPCTLINNNSSTAYFAMEGERYWDGAKFSYKDIFNSASLSTLVNCSVVTGSTNAGFIINPMATASFNLTPSSTIPKALVKFSAPNAIVYSLGDTTASGSLLGVTFSLGSAISYLLDDYGGSVAAYSFRQLSSTYSGPSIKVQDAVGGATQDIGFNGNGELDTATLLTYAGVNDVFVETWYDQSGNNNHAEQPSLGNRPKIVSNGNLITEGGKPVIQFNGSTSRMSTLSNVQSNRDTSVTWVGTRSSTTARNNTISNVNGFGNAMYGAGGDEYQLWDGSTYASGLGAVGVDQHTYFFTSDGVNVQFSINGSVIYNVSKVLRLGTQVLEVGSWSNGNYFEGTMQEATIWGVNKLNNRDDIETNINTFYNIYS